MGQHRPERPHRTRAIVDASIVVVFGIVVMFPTWWVLPPDDENLNKNVASVVYQSNELFAGRYPFWNPLLGIGAPQPLAQNLVFHPMLLLVHLFSVGTALGVFYQLHYWVGLLSMWALARHLGAGRLISLLCAVTYGLASPSILYLKNFWPVVFAQWTLAPLVLLLAVKLLDSSERRSRVRLTLALGLSLSLFLLDGHAGLLPDFGIGFAAFLALAWPRVRAVWPWLLAAFTLAAATAASRYYDLALLLGRSHGTRQQKTAAVDLAQLFLYPVGAPRPGTRGVVAIGGVFFLLALAGAILPVVRHRYSRALAAGAIACFVLLFLPVKWIFVATANYLASDPFVILATLLAAVTARGLWDRIPRARVGLAVALGLQFAAVVIGFSTFYRSELRRVSTYRHGGHVSIKNAFEDHPIYRFLESQPRVERTRTYMAHDADQRLFRSLNDYGNGDYEYSVWQLRGLRLFNGSFIGLDLLELAPSKELFGTRIGGDRFLARSGLSLDVFNIGYVLATPNDRVAPSLKMVASFRVDQPNETINVFRNTAAWPDAVLLRSTPTLPLPRLHGCLQPGLLCADFRGLARLRDGPVRTSPWRGASLQASFESSKSPRTLMLSQLYRPGWTAKLSNGKTVSGHRLLGGFTGFDVSPGVQGADINFRPTGRILLTTLTWALLLGQILALVAVTLAGRRRAGGDAPRSASSA